MVGQCSPFHDNDTDATVAPAAVQNFHWHWADPVASVTIATLIVAAVWPLVKRSAALLLEAPSAHSHTIPPTAAATAIRASATPPQIKAALHSIAGMPGVSALKRHCCQQVAAAEYVVSVQLEVSTRVSANAVEQLILQAQLALSHSSGVRECYVQTARPGATDASGGSCFDDDRTPLSDDAAGIAAVHSSASDVCRQAADVTRTPMNDASPPTIIRRSSRKAPVLPARLRLNTVY